MYFAIIMEADGLTAFGSGSIRTLATKTISMFHSAANYTPLGVARAV